jgi:hypothetical protein
MNYVSKIFINLAVEKVGVNVPLYIPVIKAKI